MVPVRGWGAGKGHRSARCWKTWKTGLGNPDTNGEFNSLVSCVLTTSLVSWGTKGESHLPCTLSVRALSFCWGADGSLNLQTQLLTTRAGPREAWSAAGKPGQGRDQQAAGPRGAPNSGSGSARPRQSGVCEAGVARESARSEHLVLGFISPLADPGADDPGRAGGPVKTVTTQEARGLRCESYSCEAPPTPPSRNSPLVVTRAARRCAGRAWACALPGALGGAMGSGEQRPRPPFNLAAGAGLAGPPGACGLPSSVPALAAAPLPGHCSVPASTLACPPPTTTRRPFSGAPGVLTPDSRISLRSTRPPLQRRTAPPLQAPRDPLVAPACLLHSALPWPRGLTASALCSARPDPGLVSMRALAPRTHGTQGQDTSTHTQHTNTRRQQTRLTHTEPTQHMLHAANQRADARHLQTHTPKDASPAMHTNTHQHTQTTASEHGQCDTQHTSRYDQTPNRTRPTRAAQSAAVKPAPTATLTLRPLTEANERPRGHPAAGVRR